MTMAMIEHDDILDTTRERFVDIVLQDEELLLLEFEAIIGSGPPRVTTCRGHRRHRQGTGPFDARRAPSATAHLAPTLEPWARQRSPPHKRPAVTDGDCDDPVTATPGPPPRPHISHTRARRDHAATVSRRHSSKRAGRRSSICPVSRHETWSRPRVDASPQVDAHSMQVRATGRASSRPGAIGRPHLSQMP